MSDAPGSGTGGPGPGWYPDPWYEASRRYWTGTAWSPTAFPDAGAGPEAGAAARAGEVDPFAFARPSTPSAAEPPGPPPAWVGPDVAPPAPASPALLRTTETVEVAPASGRRAGIVIAVVVALAVALIAGFVLTRRPATPGTATGPLPAPTAPPSPAASGPGAAPSTPGSAITSLARLGLMQGDVADTILVAPIDGGLDVQGETTLDLCDGSFPSEALREQRVQVAGFELATGRARVSTEAVIYRDADAISQVHRELDAAAADCATTSPGASIRTGVDASWPTTDGVHRQAYEVSVPDPQDGSTRTYVAVYLTRANVLLAVYFLSGGTDPPTVAGAHTVPSIVTVFEDRLARIPPAGLTPTPDQTNPTGAPTGAPTA